MFVSFNAAGIPLVGWKVFPLQLEDLSPVEFQSISATSSAALVSKMDLSKDENLSESPVTVRLQYGPKFFR